MEEMDRDLETLVAQEFCQREFGLACYIELHVFLCFWSKSCATSAEFKSCPFPVVNLRINQESMGYHLCVCATSLDVCTKTLIYVSELDSPSLIAIN